MRPIIIIAGGTGNLGMRVVKALIAQGAEVRALVRGSTDSNKIKELERMGATIIRLNNWSIEEISSACTGAFCVVSTLSGLHSVIVEAQKTLLDGAIAAGVKRFIPSDFSIDFTKLASGENRNLDLRKEFKKYMDQTSVAATTIFNGAFAEMLTGQMPLILFKFKRILYWGNATQRMDFTTMDNTATYTAHAAMDEATPRFLRIAGDQLSAHDMVLLASEVTHNKFTLFRAGGLLRLRLLIKVARTLAPGKEKLYPAWQGMQYMHNMMEGLAKLEPIDNTRYPDIRWTKVREVIAVHEANL